MDLPTFVTCDKKESLLVSFAKSNQEITHSKPQETLEFKMTKQNESFSFDVPLILIEKWMMGVTSLEVYNTVNKITNSNNKLELILKYQQLDELDIDTVLLVFVEDLCNTYFVEYNKDNEYKDNEYKEFVENVNKSISRRYSEKKNSLE